MSTACFVFALFGICAFALARFEWINAKHARSMAAIDREDAEKRLALAERHEKAAELRWAQAKKWAEDSDRLHAETMKALGLPVRRLFPDKSEEKPS